MFRRSVRGGLTVLLFVLPMAASASSLGTPPAAGASPYFCEGERYSTMNPGRYSRPAYDYKSNASKGVAMHIGSNSTNIHSGLGDATLYTISFTRTFANAKLTVRYADAVAGNQVQVYLDTELKGSFSTVATGGWNSFRWNPTVINLGPIPAGTHSVTFRVTRGGSYGLNLDQFQIQD